MADSFFSTRNMFDLQLNHLDQTHCEMLLEAVTRRMARLNGPMGAAVKTQRVADICAVAYVLPLEHWKAGDVDVPENLHAAPPAPPVEQPAHQRLTQRAFTWVENGGWSSLLIGFWLGVFLIWGHA
jgi:hypothetical protein